MPRILFTLAAFAYSSLLLIAQADPEPVNSPQRQTTYADDSAALTSPLLWLGLAVVVLLVVFLLLRRNNGTRSRAHHTNN